MWFFDLDFWTGFAIVVAIFVIASLLAVSAYGRFAKSARGMSSYALPMIGAESRIDQEVQKLAQKDNGLGVSHDGLALIANNLDAFAGRAISTILAGRSLDLMYYIWDDDLTGRLLLSEVLKAADRGVRVRLLLDDINAQGRDPAYVALDRHTNIEVRMFNPGRARQGGLRRGLEMMLRALTVTRRMHNKAFIVDGRIALVGGRNIADAYFDAGQNSNFRDLDLMLIGPSVKEVEKVFDTFWNSAVALPIRALSVPPKARDLNRWKQRLESFHDSDETRPYLDYVHRHLKLEHYWRTNMTVSAPEMVKVLSDPPEKASGKKSENWLMRMFHPILEGAQKSIELTSPYFVPGKAGAEQLCTLVGKGVDVRILTNSLAATDVAAVHGGYTPYRKRLLKGGVKLYELKRDGPRHRLRLFGSGRASLHTKAFLVDDTIGFVGSFNFDPRSVSLNTEMGIMFRCPKITTQMKKLFYEEMDGELSYQVYLTGRGQLQWHYSDDGVIKVSHREPESRWWRRLYARLISWLPIESQL